MKKVAFHNLGCKVNSYELDVVQQLLEKQGYITVPFEEKADIYIVNTCTVTNIADRKSRQMLHKAKGLNPEGIVVALGCYVQTDQEGCKKDECIDLAIGNNRKKDIVEILEAFLKERETVTVAEASVAVAEKEAEAASEAAAMSAEKKTEAATEAAAMSAEKEAKAASEASSTLHNEKLADMLQVIDINDGDCEYENMELTKTAEHTRAYIKIQDGCNQFCSYCIIPFARGRVRSRSMEEIKKEIKGLADNGYREIVLTGIHISSYGIDFEEEAWKLGESKTKKQESGRTDYRGEGKLLDLIRAIHDIPGIDRIRLGSLEPRVVTREFARSIGQLPKICPHFHLSLQSGSRTTLERMNRHYTPEEFYASVEYLREAFDRPAITTDVIVGFPGETEEEFKECKSFLEKVNFYEMHIFKYSRRRGTVADRLPNQLTEAQKTVRSGELQKLEQKMSRDFREKYVGQAVEVLFEESKEFGGKTYQIGHTVDYVKVALESPEALSNHIVTVKIEDFMTDEILLASR